MKFSPPFFLFGWSALTVGALAARAIPSPDVPTRCYVFSIPSPAREANPPPRSERWCYRQVPGPNGGTYVFNADRANVRPELALLKTKEGRLNQGSLAAGVVRFRSVTYRQFDPFSVPLEEPSHLRPTPGALSVSLNASADVVLAQLEAAQPVERENSPIAEGSTSGEASYLPWRGFWWPMKGMPMLGPLGKYDAYTSTRGLGAGAADYESVHHVSHGIWWEGHCNGWAAAAILRAEPVSSRTDGSSGQTFSVSDQKGIATETDYCAPATFYGYRHSRGSGVSPADFHNALQHYVGSLGKPIAFNLDNNGPVDNRVISGYSMDVRPSGDGFEVTARVRFHYYDASLTEATGPAPSITKTYRYTLATDADGNATGGQWLSAQPGFVWVPLSTGGHCSEGNSRMDDATSTDILR